jgi:hypothetical protein
MLKKFSVEGFRCFENKLVLDLSEVRDYRFNSGAIKDGIVKDALIYGKNAVGKSSLGRALMDVFHTIYKTESVSEGYNTAFLNANSNTDRAKFEYVFEFDSSEVIYKYEKTSYSELACESLIIDNKCIYDYDFLNDSWSVNNLESIGAGSLNYTYMDSKIPVLRYVCNNTPAPLLGTVSKLYTFIFRMECIYNSDSSTTYNLSNYIEQIIKDGEVESLQNFLNSFGIEGKLAVHDDPSGIKTLYFEFDNRPIPFIANCSSGTKALVRLFYAVSMAKLPSVLFIDEFDAFYHYDLAEAVIKMCEEFQPIQVIAATHNTDLFSNKTIRPDCVYILSKDGITSAANATKRELREGHNLEKLYKAGEFDVR